MRRAGMKTISRLGLKIARRKATLGDVLGLKVMVLRIAVPNHSLSNTKLINLTCSSAEDSCGVKKCALRA